MPQHPNPDVLSANIVQEMVGETIQITASKSALIEVEEAGILNGFSDTDVKLREEVVPKLVRNLIILSQNLIQVRLNSLVKSSFHGAEARQQARRK